MEVAPLELFELLKPRWVLENRDQELFKYDLSVFQWFYSLNDEIYSQNSPVNKQTFPKNTCGSPSASNFPWVFVTRTIQSVMSGNERTK